MGPVVVARRRVRPAILLVLGCLLSACAQTVMLNQGEAFTPRSATPRVLLMPADIELSEVSAGGIPFPKAEWTTAAIGHVSVALDEFLSARSAKMVAYEAPPESSPEAHLQGQFIKLHSAVGNAVLIHKMNPMFALPTVKDKFDYTLGEGVRALAGAEQGADYALFIYIRDSYASGERVAVIIIGAILGVGLPGGVQVGFASLVDLESGDIVWFNRLFNTVGDLRTAEPARETIENLLRDFPL